MWSTSALVSTTARIGLCRNPSRGWRKGFSPICWRRSGDALQITQSSPFALSAMEDWVLGRAAGSPERARRLFGWLQFHCG